MIVGHVCVKCFKKGERRKFMKEHKIEADKTGKFRLGQLIKHKLDELAPKEQKQ